MRRRGNCLPRIENASVTKASENRYFIVQFGPILKTAECESHIKLCSDPKFPPRVDLRKLVRDLWKLIIVNWVEGGCQSRGEFNWRWQLNRHHDPENTSREESTLKVFRARATAEPARVRKGCMKLTNAGTPRRSAGFRKEKPPAALTSRL